MTKTHHITHSDVFLRSRPRRAHTDELAAAEQLLEARDAAQDAFAALFDGIEDFDALVQECIAPLEEPAPGRRERGSADRSRFARGTTGTRARTTARVVTEQGRPASGRR